MATWIVSVALIFSQSFALAQTRYQGSSAPSGSVYDTTGGNLTDEERVMSETYVHQGLSQEAKEYGCSGTGSGQNEGNELTGSKIDMKDACAGKETHAWANWVPMVIKAYAVVVGAGLMGTYEVNKPATAQAGRASEAGANTPATSGGAPAPAATATPAQEKEKKEDYCKYVVMGTEALAMFQQTSAQQNLANLPTSIGNAQTENLYKAKRSHDERAKTAEIQAYGWGIGAGCYVVEIASGGYADWTLYLKMGLSGVACAYFAAEVNHQKTAAQKIQAVIDSMPKAGDCNPITQTNCFCSQETSKLDLANYMKYCQPQIKAEQLAAGQSMACIDKQAKADPNCLCTRTNSCFDVEFMNMIGGLKFGKSAEEVLGKSTAELSRGKLSNGNLGSGTIAQNAINRVKANMRSVSLDKVPKMTGLNPGQLGFVDELSNLGIPRSVAALAVGIKAPSNASQYANKLKAFEVDTSGLMGRNSDYGNARVLHFTGGGGNFKKTSAKKDEFDFNKLLKKKEAGASDENILKFAERASDNAQISKHPETVIFDIISNRYRLSGWKRVNFE
ncbi:MAG: hypothetical protein A2X86_17375 [Bdellovibrionales bacterium GWA2_49_15]|nr:MAG: hypothetical protein A2X86_17375 [Bdellovibrionales bacterium GWA2_49_15]HAZ13989.1 hypothetical protein [Bdellovibrionales bacterium]